MQVFAGVVSEKADATARIIVPGQDDFVGDLIELAPLLTHCKHTGWKLIEQKRNTSKNIGEISEMFLGKKKSKFGAAKMLETST